MKKHHEELSDDEAKPGYEFIEKGKEFRNEILSMSALLPREVWDAAIDYVTM